MRKKVLAFVKSIYHFFVGCIWIVKLPLCKRFFVGPSYFPEYADRRKSKFRIIMDQLLHIIHYGVPDEFYFLYGLDIKGFHNASDFVDNTQFIRRQYALNLKYMEFPPIPVLRDKSLFGIVADAYGINTPKNIGIIRNGKVYLFSEKRSVDVFQLPNIHNPEIGGGDLFVKKIDGQCADGIFHVVIKDGKLLYHNKPIDLDKFFEKGRRYLLQEAIKGQHPAINAIHPKAINTLRVVTVYNEKSDDVEHFSSVLRVGKGDNQVDNWAAGGLSIGIDTEKGTLRKYGFYKPGHGTKAAKHPDSHIVFEGYKIPYLKEAIEQAITFHRHLNGIHSIGWDIAITDEGPCFVEGNDNWEISLMQISNHGLMKEYSRLFK